MVRSFLFLELFCKEGQNLTCYKIMPQMYSYISQYLGWIWLSKIVKEHLKVRRQKKMDNQERRDRHKIVTIVLHPLCNNCTQHAQPGSLLVHAFTWCKYVLNECKYWMNSTLIQIIHETYSNHELGFFWRPNFLHWRISVLEGI